MDVKNLLEKYFEGDTSTTEERELQAYFASGQVADSLKAYIPLFAFYAEEKQVTPPMRKTRTIRMISWLAAAGIAASIALFVFTRTGQSEYVYIMDGVRLYDQQAALATADSKLQLLAASMQKAKEGMSAFDKIPNAFQQVEDNFPIFKK
ncbi:MAG: hypothetical protein LBN37_03245 [Bacteroidales bacterium]|nr:hypothetical protein [Bacteroidales bacterium]